MNRKRKKEILRNYPFIPLQIQALIDQYNEVYTAATHITTGYEDSGSGTHDNESKIEKRVIKLAELSMKIKKLQEKQKRIESAIDDLRPYHKFLINQIDVKGKGVSRVAHETHRDVSSLHKTHNKALDNLKI